MMTQHPSLQQRSRHSCGLEDSIFRDNTSEASAGSLRSRLPLDSTGTSTSRPSSSSYQSERSADSPVRRPPHIGGHRRQPVSLALPPQPQPHRVAEFNFDESEYDIVHSNAVETTEMTPFYPQPRLRLSRRSAGGGGSSGVCADCGDDCECDNRSLISSSAASCRSRKSRKSSIGSTSRVRREMRKSAAVAAAAAAVTAATSASSGFEGGPSGVAGTVVASAAAASAAVASPPAANLLANIRGLFTKWLRETKAASASAASSADAHVGVLNGTCGGGANGVKAQYLNIACPQFPQECSNSDLQHAHNVMSMSSSFDSDYLLHCYTSPSACSSAASDLPSTPCRTEDGDTEQSVYGAAGAFSIGGGCGGSGFSGGHGGASLSTVNGFVDWGVQLDYDLLQRRNPRQAARRMFDAAATTRSRSLQSQAGGGGQEQKDQLLLCSTWPPSGWRLAAVGSEEGDCAAGGGACFQVVDSVVQNSRGSFEIKEFEFNIPYDGIVFQDCMVKGRRRKVFRGQWHGDVTIHTYENLDCKERSKFWEEVAKLSLIRHENIFLFMGASMDPPTSRFAVVTCQRKGQSLYERLHMHPREKLSLACKLSIIRDLAQAAGYLHAKAILIRRFNSHNVFLEPRAKLSLQDYSVIAAEEEDRPGYLVVPASLVWYTPPEILTQLADKTSSIPDSAFTTASDVFAFSVIMYEVCGGRYPYAKCDRRQYMENVCQGKRDTVQDLRVSDVIKNLITECWCHDPLYRPEFCRINAALHNRETTSHMWHSSSEPENLHRLRFARNGFV